MKPANAIIVLLSAGLFLISCGTRGQEKEANKTLPATQADSLPAPTSGQLKLADENLSGVYQQYAQLTKALIAGKHSEAKVASNAIEAGIKGVPGGEKVAAHASKITVAKNLDQQREAYSSLSNNLITLVKKSGVSSGELYVDFCPMALNDKGAYWLSTGKEIQNPYFGDKMMTCGEIKETIK